MLISVEHGTSFITSGPGLRFNSDSMNSSYLSRGRYFQQCGMCDQQRLRPACAYAQSDQSLCQNA